MTAHADSYQIVDMDASGIVVRPISTAGGSMAALHIARSLWERVAPDRRRNLVAKLHDVQEMLGESSPLSLDFGPSASGALDDHSELETALAEARDRGRELAAEILSRPEMLSSDAFARRIGVTRETVRQKLARHEILGLSGAKRGMRFPAWQVMGDGRLLPRLPELFARLGQAWTVYRFLVQHRHPELGGRTGLAAIRDGDIDAVLAAAEASISTMA